MCGARAGVGAGAVALIESEALKKAPDGPKKGRLQGKGSGFRRLVSIIFTVKTKLKVGMNPFSAEATLTIF